MLHLVNRRMGLDQTFDALLVFIPLFEAFMVRKIIPHPIEMTKLWEEVVQNGYHGVEADVDSDVVINLCVNFNF